MKAAILLVTAGTVGLVASPAVAGSSKKRDIKKPVVAAVEKTDAAKVAPVVELPAAPQLAPEVLAIPDLPMDMSSPLAPLPELEKKLASTPVAKPMPKVSKKAKAPVMNMGKDYVLGAREANRPTANDTQEIVLKTLSQAQVATVVQAHMSDVQQCWNAIPKQLRVDACTADLKLTISETGQVTDIELGGDVPASAHKCMTSAISRWTFPAAETTSEVEYGISLRSL